MAIGCFPTDRDRLFPALGELARIYGCPIATYQEFDRDVVVIQAGEAGKQQTLELARAEIEDDRHLGKLLAFLETVLEAKMCAKVAGSASPAPPPSPRVPDEFYTAMNNAMMSVAQQPNLFLQELTGSSLPGSLALYDANVMPAEPAKPAKPSWPPAPDLIFDEPC